MKKKIITGLIALISIENAEHKSETSRNGTRS
jgi:hypothetical protein